MNASPWLTILLGTIVCVVTSGCSILPSLFGDKRVYLPPGAMAELATPVNADCWITNKKTGERERRTVEGQSGWLLVRPRVEDYGVPPVKPPELER